DASGNASITAADVNNGSHDACGIKSLCTALFRFTCANVGPNTVKLTVTDNNDNVATCDAIVTVVDSVLPTALCKNITVQLDVSGNASITAADVNNGSSDACGIKSLAIDKNTFTCASVGPNTVKLTVTDNNDNVATCDAIVTVVDSVLPTAVCKNITVQLDASGNASITAADVNNGSHDACGIKSLAIDKNTFTCANVGPNTVKLTVIDNNDNVATCDAIVTVVDSRSPAAHCKSFPDQFDTCSHAV